MGDSHVQQILGFVITQISEMYREHAEIRLSGIFEAALLLECLTDTLCVNMYAIPKPRDRLLNLKVVIIRLVRQIMGT